MNKELINIFNQSLGVKTFDSIKISIASPDNIRSWSFGEIKNLKQLIIEPLNQKKMVSSALEFLDLLKIMNVYVANTKE